VTQPSMLEKLMARGEEVWNRVSNDLMNNPQFIRALQGALKGKEFVDQAVGRALKTMNVPNRTEFKRALQRIEQLEQEVATLRAARAAAPRPRRAPAKAASTRKTRTAAKPAASRSGSEPESS